MKKIINVIAFKKQNKKEKKEEELLNILKESEENLKVIDNKITMIKNNAIISGTYNSNNTSIFNDLSLNRYDFYVTLIGAIDAKILKLESFIVEFLKDDIMCDSIDEILCQKEIYKQLRKDVISDFLGLEKSVASPEESNIIRTTLESPIYKNFSILFELNNDHLTLNMAFIKSYIKGYELGYDIDIESVINRYRELYQDLDLHMNKNEKSHEMVKLKYQNYE